MLTKEEIIDKIEIVYSDEDEIFIQIREAAIVKEDGKILSRSFHRRVLDITSDLTNESDRIKAIAALYGFGETT